MATTATTTTTPTTLGARQLNSIARNYEPANSARVANEDVDDDDDEFARRTIDPASVTTLVAQVSNASSLIESPSPPPPPLPKA